MDIDFNDDYNDILASAILSNDVEKIAHSFALNKFIFFFSPCFFLKKLYFLFYEEFRKIRFA